MEEDQGNDFRSIADLMRVGRALSRHFDTNTVVVIGSQAVLAHIRDPRPALVRSLEIDAYPGNAASWEAIHGDEASEEINASFGYASAFHTAHGFYIDGVDGATATLPRDWRDRQKVLEDEVDGRTIYIVTPALEDLVVSKLARLSDKDREWIAALKETHILDWDAVAQRVEMTLPAPQQEPVHRFLASISALQPYPAFAHDPARPGLTRERLKQMPDAEVAHHQRLAAEMVGSGDRSRAARGRLNLDALDREADKRGLTASISEAVAPPRRGRKTKREL